MILQALLDDTGLSPAVCASLLGVDPARFQLWVRGERDLPGFIVPELAAVLGISQETLIRGEAAAAPAIWYKFRGEKLIDADRELVVLIRRLGFYVHQLNTVMGRSIQKWSVNFAHVRKLLEQRMSSSPKTQGEMAAEAFRSLVDLGYSQQALDDRISGPGDIIRGTLRSMGIIVIEMPVQNSEMNGCSFYTGETGEETPCLFVNTYMQGWFRRNYVLAHELAHAIFDIDGEAALIDYRHADSEPSVKEARADAFARMLFASPKILQVLTHKLGLDWAKLSTRQLALLVAHAQVELKVIMRSAVDAEFLSAEQAEAYLKVALKKELRLVTERVLTPDEYFKLHPERAAWREDLRTTTIPSRNLRLPVSYIMAVLSAVNTGLIGEGKAAEMLMMDYSIFMDRFGVFVEELAA